jgi:hypothetical protein
VRAALFLVCCASGAVLVTGNVFAQCRDHFEPDGGAWYTTWTVLKGFEEHIPGSGQAHHGTAVHDARCHYKYDCTVDCEIKEDGSGFWDDQNLDTVTPGWFHSMGQMQIPGEGTGTPMGSSVCMGGTGFAVDSCWLGCNITITAEIQWGGGVEVQMSNHLWGQGAGRMHTCDASGHQREDGGGGCDAPGTDAADDCGHEHSPGEPQEVDRVTNEGCGWDCSGGDGCYEYVCQVPTYYYEVRCVDDNQLMDEWSEDGPEECDGGNACEEWNCCSGYSVWRPGKKRPAKSTVPPLFPGT